jgi:hypothetical protein
VLLPSAILSSSAVTVIVCAVSQLLVVKRIELVESVELLSLESDIATFEVGAVLSTIV